MEDNKDVVVNNGEPGDGKPEKTYTEQELQEKVQSSFNAGVKKASTDWQKDEKYKEFLDWKKQNQNDSDRINELTNTNASLSNEIMKLKAQIEVDSTDVKKEFSKFVTSEVMSLVNDTKDFRTALKEYKKDNPQYFGEVQIKKVQTSRNLAGGTQPQTTNSIMNDIIRGARN